MQQAIRSFMQDPKGDWVAELDCGHGQHVRHNPPFILRPWVATSEGRAIKIGQVLNCKRCDQQPAPRSVLDFWFSADMRPYWFRSTAPLDQTITQKFEAIWQQARQKKLEGWSSTPNGCLALVIVLDQLPLNMFRGQSQSFATEAQAIEVTKTAIAKQFDQKLPTQRLSFLYMPLMHSENVDDQTLAVELFTQAGLISNQRFAKHHRQIIQRFGRFPHRNSILERTTTPEELAWLASKNAFHG